MYKKLFGVGIAALILSLVAPFATAEETSDPVEGQLPAVEATTVAPEPPVDPAPPTTDPAPTPEPTTITPPPPPPPAVLPPEQALYVTPGYHLVNGRYWSTECSMYSTNTVRCRTSIYGSTVFQKAGKWFTQNTWVFNNLTYLPSPRALWANNPLGGNGTQKAKLSWTAADKRQWRTECDTANTGGGACRNYAIATVASVVNGRVVQTNKEVFNGIVRFESAATPWVKTIPAPVAPPAGVPQPTAAVPVTTNPLVQNGFRLDRRCMTGRTFCVSMSQNKMAWVIDGKVQNTVDVRFGKTATPTRLGAFKIYYKSRDHFSSIYKVDMPFALFFDGGIAIHYSANFARVGYSGGSGGCVNVRDYAQMERYFNTARVGDKVIVFN